MQLNDFSLLIAVDKGVDKLEPDFGKKVNFHVAILRKMSSFAPRLLKHYTYMVELTHRFGNTVHPKKGKEYALYRSLFPFPLQKRTHGPLLFSFPKEVIDILI